MDSAFLSAPEHALRTATPAFYRYPGRAIRPSNGANMASHSYRDTLTRSGLQPFLWTQFLGAFNDNLFKIVVSMLAVHLVAAARAGRELSIVSAVFILP